jgi:hypothetical protein
VNKNDATILYYTSNREDEFFENNIRKILVKNSRKIFNITSISQKPIDFGDNICVGDVSANDNNIYRQILIGCEAVKTPFVILAEADNLYPYDYFNFDPPDLDDIYRYGLIYVMKQYRSWFFRKPTCEGAQIAGREYLISLIKEELKDNPIWSEKQFKVNPYLQLKKSWQIFGTEIPVVSIKTGKGLRGNTRTELNGVKQLPYWGRTKTVRRRLFQ